VYVFTRPSVVFCHFGWLVDWLVVYTVWMNLFKRNVSWRVITIITLFMCIFLYFFPCHHTIIIIVQKLTTRTACTSYLYDNTVLEVVPSLARVHTQHSIDTYRALLGCRASNRRLFCNGKKQTASFFVLSGGPGGW
jgi:hypothetical protein